MLCWLYSQFSIAWINVMKTLCKKAFSNINDIIQWPTIFIMFPSSNSDPYPCRFYISELYYIMLFYFPSLNKYLPCLDYMHRWFFGAQIPKCICFWNIARIDIWQKKNCWKIKSKVDFQKCNIEIKLSGDGRCMLELCRIFFILIHDHFDCLYYYE